MTFPAAVWHLRRLFAVSALLTLVPALAVGIWLANSSAARDAAAPAAVRQAYVDHDFASYYRSEPALSFASQVYANNVQVAAEAFAGGIVAGVPTVAALIDNGANLGFAAGLFSAAGHPGEFWGLILPHGLLELTSVILAGAGGLRLGVTLITPGDRRRSAALAEEGTRAVTVVVGVAVSLAVAGTIEGFVNRVGLADGPAGRPGGHRGAAVPGLGRPRRPAGGGARLHREAGRAAGSGRPRSNLAPHSAHLTWRLTAPR